ncbi:MAG TPA: hypothetical protein VLJ19_05465 [Variovorax sp.]|nr:hypothetical protein [Variovorax sp.]
MGEQFAAIIARESFGQGDSAVEVERLLRYRMDGDQIIECWVYDEDQRFVDARVAG